MIYISSSYSSIEFCNANGGRHRDNGPAFIGKNYLSWYQNGKWHRDDGPAIIDIDCQTWYRYGKLHRLDGPAIIDIDYQKWYIDGVKYTERSYYDKLREMGS